MTKIIKIENCENCPNNNAYSQYEEYEPICKILNFKKCPLEDLKDKI